MALLPQHEKRDWSDQEGDVRRARERDEDQALARSPMSADRHTDTQDGYKLMCPLLLSKQHGCLVVAHFLFALTDLRS